MWMGYAIENPDKAIKAADLGFPWGRGEEDKYVSMEMKDVWRYLRIKRLNRVFTVLLAAAMLLGMSVTSSASKNPDMENHSLYSEGRPDSCILRSSSKPDSVSYYRSGFDCKVRSGW